MASFPCMPNATWGKIADPGSGSPHRLCRSRFFCSKRPDCSEAAVLCGDALWTVPAQNIEYCKAN